jgi:hypothetical protein
MQGHHSHTPYIASLNRRTAHSAQVKQIERQRRGKLTTRKGRVRLRRINRKIQLVIRTHEPSLPGRIRPSLVPKCQMIGALSQRQCRVRLLIAENVPLDCRVRPGHARRSDRIRIPIRTDSMDGYG